MKWLLRVWILRLIVDEFVLLSLSFSTTLITVCLSSIGEQMAPLGIRTEEWYEINSNDQEIFCKCWLPEIGVPLKGTLCFCHGYGDTCTFFFEGRPEIRGFPRYLLGQSMGGAVALKVLLNESREWDGVVLVAPMCKIAEDMRPPEPLASALIMLARVVPKAKLVPGPDLAELIFRDLNKRKMASYNVICYNGKTRLKTAVELIKATRDIESQLEKQNLPYSGDLTHEITAK